MWPASASTTIPSGIGPAAVTMTFLSEPSGFTETMWPPLASRKNRRGPTAFRIAAGRFDLGVCVSIIVSFLVLFVLLLWSLGLAGFSIVQPLPVRHKSAGSNRVAASAGYVGEMGSNPSIAAEDTSKSKSN